MTTKEETAMQKTVQLRDDVRFILHRIIERVADGTITDSFTRKVLHDEVEFLFRKPI